jgi:phosphoglycolate phosphatase
MKLDAIIFDLDGTLWDSTNTILDSWNKTIGKHDEIDKQLDINDIKGMMGLSISDIAKKIFPYLDEKRGLDILNKCCKNDSLFLNKHGAILYEKLEYVLSVLIKDYRLFIVSNCQDGYIESFLNYHNLNKYFEDYEYIGRTGLKKGENIKLVINRNNLKSAIYVGDTQGDKDASKVAGIPFVYASYGFGSVDGYDYKIDCLEDIFKVIDD